MTDLFFIVVKLLMGACQVVSEVLSLNVTQMQTTIFLSMRIIIISETMPN